LFPHPNQDILRAMYQIAFEKLKLDYHKLTDRQK